MNAYALRLKRRLINELNSKIGTRGYQAYHDNVFLPNIKRINAATGTTPEIKDADAYIARKRAMEEDTRYDAVITKKETWLRT